MTMKKTLFDILNGIQWTAATNFDPKTVLISGVSSDSRLVQAGDLFVAVRGVHVDGHAYIQAAIEKGAAAVMAETFTAEQLSTNLPLLTVPNTSEALGWIASNFYDHPSRQMQIVGVTGTNGKTSTVTLLWQLFTRLGATCGLIGTVENRIGDQILSSTHTTPDAISLQRMLRAMADAHCQYVFMEVSSHAIHQRRIGGLQFTGALFSNITHDHLDYHGTFAAYRDAKKRLFDDLPAAAFALTNIDDKNGIFMLQNTQAQKHTYGLKKPADFKTKIIENELSGLYLQIDGSPLHARMIGEFNAYNLTAVYAAAILLGKDKMETLTALSDLRGAEGRFDYVIDPVRNIIGIVDYAHTPDAVEKVLETIKKLKKPASNIITVIGCGGDRDKTKRPIMAKTAAQWSNQVILTSDNPRTEDPAVILKEMEAGLDKEDLKKTLTIENREQAIKTAVRLAKNQDIILVAGKGHEKYQEIMGVKHDFDDKEILNSSFE